MAYTNRVSEELHPMARLDSDQQLVGTYVTAWCNLRNYHRGFFVLNVGDIAAGGTVDAGLQQATDLLGTGAKAIAGKTITQLTQAGGDGNDLCGIELQTEELDVDNAFDCVRAYVRIGTAVADFSAILYGAYSRFEPVPTTQWTEIVG